MNPLRYTPLTLAALVVVAVAAGWLGWGRPGDAAAQERQDRPLRIAVANVPRIIADLRETVDLDEKFRAERDKNAAENIRMQEQIKSIQAQAGNFRPDSPQYEDLQKQHIEAVAKWKVWGETSTMDRDMRKKRLIKMLHDKVNAAIAEYASREGIDLVLGDVQPTDQNIIAAPVERLGDLLAQRRVLYSAKSVDISQAITALVDSKYRASGAVGGAGTGAGGPATPGGSGGGGAQAPGAADARPASDAGPRQNTGAPAIPRRGNDR